MALTGTASATTTAIYIYIYIYIYRGSPLRSESCLGCIRPGCKSYRGSRDEAMRLLTFKYSRQDA